MGEVVGSGSRLSHFSSDGSCEGLEVAGFRGCVFVPGNSHQSGLLCRGEKRKKIETWRTEKGGQVIRYWGGRSLSIPTEAEQYPCSCSTARTGVTRSRRARS